MDIISRDNPTVLSTQRPLLQDLSHNTQYVSEMVQLTVLCELSR